MGKNAFNEMVKLRATFLNNLGIGVVLTGFLVPFWTIFQGYLGGKFPTLRGVIVAMLSGAVAVVLGKYLHHKARESLSELED